MRGTGKPEFAASDINPGDTLKIDYEFSATYHGNIVETLAAVKRLADKQGARAIGQVRMYLLDVIRALEGL